MKRRWTNDELAIEWTLTAEELTMANGMRGKKNRLGYAIQLKWFQLECRFPKRKQEVPIAILAFVATQLGVPALEFKAYDFKSRSCERHRHQIRRHLGFREATIVDAAELRKWLIDEPLSSERQIDKLRSAVIQQCRILKIEPPAGSRLERIIRAAIHEANRTLYEQTASRLDESVRQKLNDLLNTGYVDKKTGEITRGRSTLHYLRRGAGAVTIDTLLGEIDKLTKIEAVGLPDTLFADVNPHVLDTFRQRVAIEELHEVRRHADKVRFTLLSAYCWQRRREIIDTVVDVLLDLIHRMQVKAERKTDQIVLQEIKRVQGKERMLYEIADAAVAKPEEKVKDAIYPTVGKQSLQDVIAEYEAVGSYEVRVRHKLRTSYGHHYRRMLPKILDALEFCSNNKAHQPLIEALKLLKKYRDSKRHEFPPKETVPLEGVIPDNWRPFITRKTKRSGDRINRISYEVCVLRALRDKIRCREVWVAKSDRYRDPDKDVPADFAQKRDDYLEALNQPKDASVFITQQQAELRRALQQFNDGLPNNEAVSIDEKRGKPWITLSPLTAVTDPVNLIRLKNEVKRRWGWTNLLDMLKETDLQTNFSRLFTSATGKEALPRGVLRKRLLLCLYAFGTNTGLSRIAAGDDTVSHRDLQYVRRRYITNDALRAAIGEVANAVFHVRQPEWWGEETTACASDGKKFGAWDQNLLTEWHIRYRGPGVLVYWHVEKKSVCIYSQVKRCSSSEVAAMIEGVLRHCTDMTVTKQYVDSHGQSEVAFALTHLLGFKLMPRLKRLGSKKLYVPEKVMLKSLTNLTDILVRRPIDWELIQQQYDEMVKYATALRLGTADAEAILRRFTQNGIQHPTYRALQELGRVRRTIFLCHYLHEKAVRKEVQAGLNVVENWNRTNTFIFYARSSELQTNNREEQELAVLSLHLLQICMVYINTLMLQQVLKETAWQTRMLAEDRRALTPLFFRHVTPYGIFQLNLEERLDLDKAPLESLS